MTKFRVILLDDLAVTCWRNQATVTSTIILSERALNDAENLVRYLSGTERTARRKTWIDSNGKNWN